MQKKDDLIRENALLKKRLQIAESWIKRQGQEAIFTVQRERIIRASRKKFDNMFEVSVIDDIRTRYLSESGDIIRQAPPYTLDRLIDAEIYWYLLQKFPHMDGLPMIISYQKIIDDWIESVLIAPWRQEYHSTGSSSQVSPIERDLSQIIDRHYTLSIGRLYQIITSIRHGDISGDHMESLMSYWRCHIPRILDALVSDQIYQIITELINTRVFSQKRHESKVTYREAGQVRGLMRRLLDILDGTF